MSARLGLRARDKSSSIAKGSQNMWEAVAGFVSAIIAAIGLMVAWRRSRETALRTGEVLSWSQQVISAMQRLNLICQGHASIDPEMERDALRQIYFETSVLAEQGRLFFRNAAAGDHGADKPEAYRGRRPEILDQILVAHAIAGTFTAADKERRARMCCVAHDAARRFVTLAQKEVGRSRTVSAETSKGGTGTNLDILLAEVAPERLA